MRRKTHKEFSEELSLKNAHIRILEEYQGSDTKIKIKCNICEYEWSAVPYSLLKGHGCAVCAGKIKKSNDTFIVELYNINPNIDALEEYKNNKTKIKVRCKIDGHEWMVTPSHLLGKRGCPKCATKARAEAHTKSHVQFVNELFEINTEVDILEKYINCRSKIQVKCKIDGHEWSAIPNDLLSGSGCPVCMASKGEKLIYNYLKLHNVIFEYQKKYFELVGINGGNLSYDFFLPHINLLIEYQGEYHNGFVAMQTTYQCKKQVEHDKRKKVYAKEHNIDLLEIWYWEFDNIENILSEILKINYKADVV